MKRGINEKSTGPMFPRLHVNDTEKGGPRAPPRNKMALYEQFSIPSQRFSGGAFPLNPNSTANYVLLPSSSSQGGVSERGSFFPLQQTPSMHAADKMNNRFSDLNNQLVQQEQKKKQEDDDLRVPIFVQQSGINLDRSGNHQNKDNEGLSSFSSAFSGRFTNVQKASERNVSQDPPKSASNQSSRQSTKVQLKKTNGSSTFGPGNASNNSIRLQSNGNSRDHVVDSQADNNVGGNSVSNETRAVGYGNSSPIRGVQQEVLRSPNDSINGDAVSETSMVDSISGADISPDDVVGIIGQKHFWKARRAIVNQQRVFAVQVFELHRLIKVQRLIAGLPQLMVEDDAFLGKPAKVSPIKKIPLEYVMKSSTNVPKLKDYREKPKDDMREFSAENAVEKASLSSVQNSSRSTFSGFPLPPSDPKMGSWSLNQPPGHQWLIPVMSPLEGLIYKPYPGPGYMSPRPGPPGSASVIGHNFVNDGVLPPAGPHYQWPIGFHLLVPPAAHGYFPPFGMTMVNPSSGEGMNPFNVQYQSPCNVPTVAKFHVSNNSEVQGSTASSPSDNRDALPLFPTCPPAKGGTEPARVIRVMPHNARSATESVARIFQSIQEERKHQDPV